MIIRKIRIQNFVTIFKILMLIDAKHREKCIIDSKSKLDHIWAKLLDHFEYGSTSNLKFMFSF